MNNFIMKLMRLSDDELLNQFQSTLLRNSLDGVVLKNNKIDLIRVNLIREEIKRRMKW